jgi:hypothetical protein
VSFGRVPPSPSCCAPIEETRNKERFVPSALGIKTWREATPTCTQARPKTCPCCGVAGQPVGKRLTIVGHGLVERQVLGPEAAKGAAERATVQVRRYRCRACKAILVVGPRGLIPRRWYGAGAIALAFAKYARGETSAAVRHLTSPSRVVGGSAGDRWMTLVRWLDAAGRGELFAVSNLGALARRNVAEQVTLALAARAGRELGGDLAEAAFAGAAEAA